MLTEKCRWDTILLFTSAIMLAFAKCQRELQRPKFKLFLLFSGLFILPGSQYTVQPCLIFSDTVLIFWKNFILLDFCFSATCVNLISLAFTVSMNSSLFRLENERNSWIQMISTNDAEPFDIFLILKKFICLLVYFITFTMNHVSQVSHWILWWFLATGRLQILQGNFTTIF